MDRQQPTLVGRTDSLARLEAALARADAGRPGVVVVHGETGAGKTRLVQEFCRRADPIVLGGSCVPVAGSALPFAPLVQGLRRLAGDRDAGHVVRSATALAPLLPGEREPAAPGDERSEDDTYGQLRLFQAVLALLERLTTVGARSRPAVHVVEDLHWADRSTLDLLRFLATNLGDERVLVVVTYRTDEVEPGSDLHGWLAEVNRLPSSVRVPLARLGEDDTVRLVTELLGHAPEPAYVASVLARSAGNPLFVEHLVRHGGSEEGLLPETLHDLLLTRVGSLPDETRGVLRAASVLGRRGVPVDLLAAMVGEPVAEVEDKLRPALAARVMEVRDEDRVGFGHPAFREVVYAELMPGERARAHRSAAEALQAWPVPPRWTVGEVARHWHLAGDLPRALDAALAAGAAAEEMLALADAYSSFQRAADLMQQVGGGGDRVDALARAGHAAGLLGEDEAAVRCLTTALEETGDGPRRPALLERLGAVHIAAGRGPASLQALREAQALLADGRDPLLLARVQADLALQAASWSRLGEAEAEGTVALEAARRVGSLREEGRALNALAIVASFRGRNDEAARLMSDSLAVTTQAADADGISAAYMNLAHVLGVADRTDELVALCRQGVDVLRGMGLLRQSGALLMANTAEALTKVGRLDEAEAVLADAQALHARGIMTAPVCVRAAQLAVVRGRLVEARADAARARRAVEAQDAPVSWVSMVAEAEVEVELWAGEPESAYAIAERSLAAIAEQTGATEPDVAAVLVLTGVRAVADLAEAHRDPESRRRQEERLQRLLTAWDPSISAPGLPDLPALTAAVDAELSRARHARDPEIWRRSHEAWRARDRPFAAAYAGWRYAEALLAGGGGGRAVDALREARDEAVALGAPLLVGELDRLARWYRVDVPRPREASEPADSEAGAAASLQAYGLTARELEVLARLAAGRTNAEIASELFISIKTASVHVSNILRKLDVPGRQEAGRVAHRHGIRA